MKTLILLEKLAISLGKAEETSHPFCLEMPKGLGSQLHTSWTASLLLQTKWTPRPSKPLAPRNASEAARLAAFLPFSAFFCLWLCQTTNQAWCHMGLFCQQFGFAARHADSLGTLSSVPLNPARTQLSSHNESYEITAVSLSLMKENPRSYKALSLLLRCKDDVQTFFLSYMLQKHWRRGAYINTEIML